MRGKVVQQTFNAVERELIRKKLMHYMKENGIGAPKLAQRIKASHPRETEIPLSTLQRFLVGRGKNESCVALCHRFVERLTVSDPIAKLGQSMSIFYGADSERDYSGTYESSAIVRTSVQIYSKIDIVADAGFWRVTETITYPDDHAIYDGVLVCSGYAAVVVLKDRLVGLARNYILWPEDDRLLRGRGSAVRGSAARLRGSDTINVSYRTKTRLETITPVLKKTG